MNTTDEILKLQQTGWFQQIEGMPPTGPDWAISGVLRNNRKFTFKIANERGRLEITENKLPRWADVAMPAWAFSLFLLLGLGASGQVLVNSMQSATLLGVIALLGVAIFVPAVLQQAPAVVHQYEIEMKEYNQEQYLDAIRTGVGMYIGRQGQ